MNFCDLFSGIGGFRIAAEWAGYEFEHEVHSDIDEYANKVYAKHFPNSIQLGDITKINWHEVKEKYKGEWIVTGGFPCQDISIAGKGAGLAGSRSGLWFEMQKAISILRPKFVIAENVGALTFRGLDTVLLSLAEIGYDVEWQDIRASDVGAPHRRERIWIIAYPQSTGAGENIGGLWGGIERHSLWEQIAANAESLGRRNGASENEQSSEREEHSLSNAPPCSDGEVAANAPQLLRSSIERSEQDGDNQRAASHTNSQRLSERRLKSKLDVPHEEFRVEHCDRDNSGVRSWREDWLTVASEFCRMDARLPNRVDRLRTLGNTIVPQIAMILFTLIKPHTA